VWWSGRRRKEVAGGKRERARMERSGKKSGKRESGGTGRNQRSIEKQSTELQGTTLPISHCSAFDTSTRHITFRIIIISSNAVNDAPPSSTLPLAPPQISLPPASKKIKINKCKVL